MSSLVSFNIPQSVLDELPSFPTSLLMRQDPIGRERAVTARETSASSDAAQCGCEPHEHVPCPSRRRDTPHPSSSGSNPDGSAPYPGSPCYSPSAVFDDAMETEAGAPEDDDDDVPDLEEVPRPPSCPDCPGEIVGHARCPHQRTAQWSEDYAAALKSAFLEMSFTLHRGLVERRGFRTAVFEHMLRLDNPASFWAELLWIGEQLLRQEPDEIVDGQRLYDVIRDFQLMEHCLKIADECPEVGRRARMLRRRIAAGLMRTDRRFRNMEYYDAAVGCIAKEYDVSQERLGGGRHGFELRIVSEPLSNAITAMQDALDVLHAIADRRSLYK